MYNPSTLDYEKLKDMHEKQFLQDLTPEFSPWLLFKGNHHFQAMDYNSKSKGFPNGHFKRGTIRYRKDKVLLPMSERCLVFESSEFEQGKAPRGFIIINQVVIAPLEELTRQEILEDGFKDRKDMIHQMTEMNGRHYKDLTPKSIISYFSFGCLNTFSGFGSDLLALYPLLTQGNYWNQLKQNDKTGWTKKIRF
jgi:hypothetical protein